MNDTSVSMVSLIVLGFGGLVAVIGTILLLVAAFRQSIIWGLVALFVPLGEIVYVCVHWAEAKTGFLAKILGWAIFFAGLFSIPGAQEKFWASVKNQNPHAQTQAAATAPNLDQEIQDQRQKIESLQAAFAQDGVELTKQYQSLEAARKALKPKDAAGIAKFNEAAAAYQARNLRRKQMQQDIDAAQKQLESLLDTRSRAAAAAAHKVVMYTTSQCPACRAAKEYLAKKGVPYQEIDVESSREGAEEFRKLGGRGVPLIVIGNKRMEGFSQQTLDAAL
jgi:glutaredoxin-like YruB-family protein